MSKMKTYNKNNFKKGETKSLLSKMEEVYFAFAEIEHYCATHLDNDLSKEELIERALRNTYDYYLDRVCDTDDTDTIPVVVLDRMHYMNTICEKICH